MQPHAFRQPQPEVVQMSSVTSSDETNDWDPGDATSSDDEIDLGCLPNFQSTLSIFTDDPFEQFIFDF